MTPLTSPPSSSAARTPWRSCPGAWPEERPDQHPTACYGSPGGPPLVPAYPPCACAQFPCSHALALSPPLRTVEVTTSHPQPNSQAAKSAVPLAKVPPPLDFPLQTLT